ncbi:MAG TPA: hypothetical protein VGD95_04440 [Micavibrio sp.]
MFNPGEIKRNLLGCLEIALLMRKGRDRFGNNYDEAMRSFIVPILLSPIVLLVIMLYPAPEISEVSRSTLALVYALRMFAVTALFLGAVWWIVRELDRREYFLQFVTAMNWLSVPATIVILPALYLVFSGMYSWQEIYPITCVLVGYSYLFTGFMAAHVLRIPLELAGFITFISYAVNTHTLDIMNWVGQNLLS